MKFSFGLELNDKTAEQVAHAIAEWQRLDDDLEAIYSNLSSEDVAGAFSILTKHPIIRRPQDIADKSLLDKFDENFLKYAHGIPISNKNQILTIALINPYLPNLADRCQQLFPNTQIQICVTPFEDLSSWFQRLSTTDSDVDESLMKIETVEEVETIRDFDLNKNHEGVEGKLKEIFVLALNNLASDIHLVVERDRFYYEFRIDGDITDETELPYKLRSYFDSTLVQLAGKQPEDRRDPISGRFTLTHEADKTDVRYERTPTYPGFHVTLRLHDALAQNLELGKGTLILDQHTMTWTEKLLEAPHGLILIAGPTGSGKSTTLYAMLKRVNLSKYNILTLENPVELEIPGIKQCLLKNKSEFEKYMESFLRSDPDIILVGEIRDFQSAEYACQASTTGHLVFSTIHCDSAPEAPFRLMDFKIPRWKVASSLIGAFSQRLVRTLCPNCKNSAVPVTSKEIKLFDLPEKEWVSAKVSSCNVNGCAQCGGKGYGGRRAILEGIPFTRNLKALLSKDSTTFIDVENFAKENYKLASLRDIGLDMIKDGTTDFDALKEVVNLSIL